MKTSASRLLRRFSSIWLLALTLLILHNPVSAQEVLDMGQTYTGLNDTLNSGDSVNIVVTVFNNSTSQNYLDTLFFDGYVDTGGVGINVFALAVVSPALITSSSSSPFIIKMQVAPQPVSGPSFRIGGNVIVVWPRPNGPPFTTGDSLLIPVTVLDATSIGEIAADPIRINCFPNPARNLLYIQANAPNSRLASILVRDVHGRIIETLPCNGLPVNVSQWDTGVYLLEFQFENGERRIRKVIR
jgi:hypothetical protein